MALLALLTGALAVMARTAMSRAAAGGKVDHYYWMLVADAYRTQRGLPVRLGGKYLLEDDTQAYPPLFGWLLGRWGLATHATAAVFMLELIQVCAMAMLLAVFKAPYQAIALAAAFYMAAPILVMYNTQLNARILGDVFLFGLLAVEACAILATADVAARVCLWGVAVLLTALIILTHKMTLQLHLALLVPWTWALGSWLPVATLLMGAVLYVSIVGHRFARYQFRAHWDIVKFWNTHWPTLGGHQFGILRYMGSRRLVLRPAFIRPGCWES